MVDTSVTKNEAALPSTPPEKLQLADQPKGTEETATPSAAEKMAPVVPTSNSQLAPKAPIAPTPIATVKPVAPPSTVPAPSPIAVVPAQPLQADQINTTTYVVQKGDTLWKIASQSYGDGQYFSHISQANNIKNPNLIFVGQSLKITALSDQQKAVQAPATKGQISGQAWSQDNTHYMEYTIIKGDSLWKIAEAQLGDPYRWPELYHINKAVIGKNANLIYPGTVIKIPDDKKPVSLTPQSFNWTSSLLQ